MEDLCELLEKLKKQPSELLESEILEFKEFSSGTALHGSKELAEELVAFANNGGGRLIVGVRDSSNVSNLNWESQLVGFPKTDILETTARLKGKIKPSIDLKLSEFEYESKNYLVVDVPGRTDTLITTSSGKVCIRDGRSSRPMTPDEIAAAVKSLTSYDWSADRIQGRVEDLLDLADVDEALADFASRRALHSIDRPAFLEAIGATNNGVITRAGLLFFGLPVATKRILGLLEFRFSWKTSAGVLLQNDVWTSNLWTVIKKSRSYFAACNVTRPITFRGKIYDAPLLDPVAFHEALMNALVHRDYSKDGIVAVDYNSKSIKISSPGSFYGGVTQDNIYRHQPRHRNKSLAKLMMDFALVDRAGMGVPRMSLQSLKYGRSFPEFKEASGFVQVTMQGEYLRPAVFVLANSNPSFGVVEMVILNSVFEVGAVAVEKVIAQLSKVVDDPWNEIQTAVGQMPYVEFCANRDEVLIRVSGSYRDFMDVQKVTATSPASPRLVKLYEYLKRHGSASNADITRLLEYKYSTQTSDFLRKTKFVRRVGNGPQAVWKLIGS